MPKIDLIDWSKKYPNESNQETCQRQSTYCPCGNTKEIGKMQCVNHCEKCGMKPGIKMLGDERYNYCADCNWITH